MLRSQECWFHGLQGIRDHVYPGVGQGVGRPISSPFYIKPNPNPLKSPTTKWQMKGRQSEIPEIWLGGFVRTATHHTPASKGEASFPVGNSQRRQERMLSGQ